MRDSNQTPSLPALGTRALRRAGTTVLALGLSATLAACGGSDEAAKSPTPAASGTPAANATPAASATPASSAPATPKVKPTVIKDLSALTVTPTEPGKAPSVKAKWPLAVEKTQVKVLSQGDGPTVAKGGQVEVHYQGVNARTGKVFDESFSRGQTATFSTAQVVTGFKKALEGQKVGSRVLVMMTGADGYDSTGGNPQAGIEKGDNLVFVIDVVSTPFTKATGTAVEAKAGLPTVKEDAKGVPSVTVPKTAAPAKLEVQPLIKGPGAQVKANDAVMVTYRAYLWDGGTLVADGYKEGPQTGKLTDLIPAWKKGLVNQTVGSRVLIVSPPADAYGNQKVENIPAKSTMVYVIDILHAMDASQAVQ
ncbi:FKBP-type peptidyl-prolyl cis-trans isomerase [Luteococcus sediminum]